MTLPIENRSLAEARPYPVWQETRTDAPAAPRLTGELSCDIAIVGGGFVGLWTALIARQRWPDATIVVLEAGQCGGEASGRSGGFCAPSISHGVSNALKRWPKEAEQLVRLGRENLVAFEEDLQCYGMDASFERSGKLNVASQPWQVDGLKSMQRNYARFGIACEYLEGSGSCLLIRERLFQVPAPLLITDVLSDLLHLQVIVQSPLAQLAANPAVLHPAPRGFDEGRLRAVDPDDSRA